MIGVECPIVHTSVFPDGPDGGNPCPVVLGADNLSAADGMALAKKFGAETIFVIKPSNTEADFGLRFFVPRHEMEMCVHGTIAAVTVMWENGSIDQSNITIATTLGNIEVVCEEVGGCLAVTVFQFPAKFAQNSPTLDEISNALRIPTSAIDLQEGPIISASTSRHKLIVPIKNTDLLNRIEPGFEELWSLCDRYDTSGLYPFARTDRGISAVYSARQFPKRTGYNEDPATGVAACALGAYLAKYHSKANGWQEFEILQGYAMGRPSRLSVGAFLENGQITKSYVSGNASLDRACTPL